jgi:phenylalanyl-tRNA synthetase beta chain
MIVSWNWLRDYLRLEMSVEALTEKLALSGLNHESTEDVGGDLAIDLEVTSNRPDCLNHLGIAREIGVLFGLPVRFPDPIPTAKPKSKSVTDLASVENLEPTLCSRFTARVVTGARVAESPWWLRKRLETLGVRPISNVVDITNYVLFECGQPLHAYDLDKLAGKKLVVRRGSESEKLQAINGKTYEMKPGMLVIADAEKPVGLAGVMGGLETEISASTRDILIESARFDPVSVRNTSRALGLFSPSSHRFERPMDPEITDWASRRCAELILDLAGGALAEGVISIGEARAARSPIVLRLSQITRILGIEIPESSVVDILVRLGLEHQADAVSGQSTWIAPSWRCDLEREIDLIEEVARIHGYHHIPEDRPVPMAVASRTPRERVESGLRDSLTAAGLFEAVTFSLIAENLAKPIPGDLPPQVKPIRIEHSSRKKETTLRPSLVPSLLEARAYNQAHGSPDVHLFEIAHVYLPRVDRELPDEPVRLAAVTGGDWQQAKGLAEALASKFHLSGKLVTRPISGESWSVLAPGLQARLELDGRPWGIFGSVAPNIMKELDLRLPCAALELDLSLLVELAVLEPQYRRIPDQPAVTRDLSLVVPDRIVWSEISRITNAAAGPWLESVEYLDEFKGGNLAADERSVHFGMSFRNPSRTLSGDEADAAVAEVVRNASEQLGARLRV